MTLVSIDILDESLDAANLLKALSKRNVSREGK